MGPLRLLLVLPSYYPDAYGGAERQALILARALARRGVVMTLLAPSPSLEGATAREETDFGAVWRIRVRDLPARGGRYLLSTLAWTIRSARFIHARRRAFDLVYVFHGRLHVVGPLLGARAAGLPLFVKPGGGGANSDYRALRRKRYLYGHAAAALKTRWASGFVAVSGEVERDLHENGVPAARIHPLPNGVELVEEAALEQALAGRTGERFISTCRLVAEKNLHLVLQALASLPRGRLTVVGDGPEEAALRRLALHLGLGDRVRFLGALPAVGPEVIAHDAFVTASAHEGQSNSLLEALAAGVIPVAASASGVTELIEDDVDGVLAGPPSVEGLAAAMGRVLGLSAGARLAMGRAAYAKARARFGVDAVAGRLLALFQEAPRR